MNKDDAIKYADAIQLIINIDLPFKNTYLKIK
jgi:hypothetical protein